MRGETHDATLADYAGATNVTGIDPPLCRRCFERNPQACLASRNFGRWRPRDPEHGHSPSASARALPCHCT
jgi:hypothetical protein